MEGRFDLILSMVAFIVFMSLTERQRSALARTPAIRATMGDVTRPINNIDPTVYM
jgi:hypothetical protein